MAGISLVVKGVWEEQALMVVGQVVAVVPVGKGLSQQSGLTIGDSGPVMFRLGRA